jgi:hypothetical protein
MNHNPINCTFDALARFCDVQQNIAFVHSPDPLSDPEVQYAGRFRLTPVAEIAD